MHIYFHTFHILREPTNAFNKYKTINYTSKRNDTSYSKFFYDLSFNRLKLKDRLGEDLE